MSAAAMAYFNKIKFVRTLTSSGMSEDHANAIADAFGDLVLPAWIARERDILERRYEMKFEMDSMRNEMDSMRSKRKMEMDLDVSIILWACMVVAISTIILIFV